MYNEKRRHMPELDNQGRILLNFTVPFQSQQAKRFLSYQSTAQLTRQLEEIHHIHSYIQNELATLPRFFQKTAEKASIREEMLANSHIAGLTMPRYREAIEGSQCCSSPEKSFASPYITLLKGETTLYNTYPQLVEIHQKLLPLAKTSRNEDPLDTPLTHMANGEKIHFINALDEILMAGNGQIPVLIQIAIRHFLLTYIKPFEVGNGLLTRYLSCYQLYQFLGDFSFLPFSLALDEYQEDFATHYQNVFTQVSTSEWIAERFAENPILAADMTGFIYAFLFCLQSALKNSYSRIQQEKRKYQNHLPSLEKQVTGHPMKLAEPLFISTLFEGHGLSVADAANLLSVNRKTINAYLSLLPHAILTEDASSRPSKYAIYSKNLA